MLTDHEPALLARLCCSCAAAAVVAAYPERPVTIVVPFAPGGANDVVVRDRSSSRSAEALGQPIVVENRGGAGGSIGFGWVARARSRTATRCCWRRTRSRSIRASTTRSPTTRCKDFDPVAEISTFPVIFAVRPDIGVEDAAGADRATPRRSRARSTTRRPDAAPCRISRPSCSSSAPASTWCTFPMRAPRRPRRRCSARPSTSASCRSRSRMPQIQAGQAQGAGGDRRASAGPTCRTCRRWRRPACRSRCRRPGRASWCRPARRRTSSTASPRRWSRSRGGRTCARSCVNAGFAATGRGPDAFAKRIADDVPKWKDVIEKARISVK